MHRPFIPFNLQSSSTHVSLFENYLYLDLDTLMNLDYNISNRMSVSLSSFYEQTPALRAIQEKIQKTLLYQQSMKSTIRQIVVQACEISMPQCYRLLAILAKYLKSSNSILHKFAILLLSKQLFLTALHHFYIFGSIKIIPWVKSIASFQTRKKMTERVRLYLQQMSLKGNGDEVVQQRYCFKLLGFVDEFLPWFALNFPYHINALFQFSSTFKKNLSSLPNPSTGQFFEYFSERDFEKFEKNFNILKCQSSLQLKEMCDFIGLEVRSIVDQQKEKSQLLKEAVRTADSYCIKTIISELTNLLEDSSKLIPCVRIIDFLVVQGQIQFNQLVKIYCLPILLQYILPINFSNTNGSGKRVDSPPRRCSPPQEKTVIDCIYKWAKICEQLNIPVSLYVVVMRLMQNAGKPILNIKRKHYSDYLTNVIQMHETNNQKRPEIQNPQIQKQLIGIVENRAGTHKQSRSVEKHPILWKSNISAINQLQDFQESRVNFGKKIQNKSIFWKSKVSNVGEHRGTNADSFNNFFKSQVTTSKPIQNQPASDNCMSIEIISRKTPHKIFSGYREDSFHPSKLSESETPKYIQIQKSNEFDSQSRSGRSSFKPQPEANNQGRQKVNGESVSSYVPFEASKMSGFSELSVKKSNENNAAFAEYYKKNDENRKSKEKSQLRESKSKLRSSKQSKSQSIIYFNNSHEFHSESRIKIYRNSQKNTQNKKLLDFQEPNDENPSVGTQQYFVKALNPIKTPTPQKILKNSDSLSRSKSSEPNNATIYFKNSIHSKNNDDSLGSSKLTQYGIQGNYLPEPTKKPKFGFKKANNAQIRDSNANNQFLGSDAFTNFQYTGNRHNFNIGDNILSSQGSQLAFSSNNFNRGGHVLGGARIMMNSEKEISEIEKKKGEKNNLKVKSTDRFYDVQVRMPKVREKSEYGESSSEIKDEIFKKYKMSESREFNINTLSKGSEFQDNEYRLEKKYRSPDKFIIQEYENDKLLDLQKEVGKARRAKQQKEKQLKERQEEYKKIKELAQANSKNRQKINNLKKQNQILELLTLQKNQEEYEGSYNAEGVIKPIKNQIRIQDYFLVNEVKGLYSPYTQPFERIFIKQLLGSRCLLIKNEYMELGYNYSQRGNEISLYLTLIKAYDEVDIRVLQNSILLNQDVEITMHDVPARNQLKIKRKVKGILQKKKDPTFSQIIHQNPSQIIVYPQICITLTQHGDRPQQFTSRIPCSIFNLAVPVQINSEIIRPLQNRKVIKSPQMRLSDEFLRNPKQKMNKYFPYAVDLSQGWCLIGYEYKQQIFGRKSADFIKYRIEGTRIEFEFFGDPKNPLIETLVCMLVGSERD